MKTGIIYDESLEQYHQADGFSASRLKVFRRLPALYEALFVKHTIQPKPPTAALSVGTALDLMLLHGVEAYEKRVVVSPDTYGPDSKPWHWGAKECKAWGAAHAGKVILSPEDAGLVEEMAQTVFRHPDAAALLENGKPGVTFRYDYGFAVGQCQCDWLNLEGTTLPSEGKPSGPYWVELKSAASLNSADFYGFRDAFVDKEYFLQTPLYREIIADVLREKNPEAPLPRVFFIVVDKGEIPFCQVFDPLKTEAGRIQFNLARQKVMRDVERLKACYESGVWPGLPGGILSLELPSWQEKRLIEELG